MKTDTKAPPKVPTASEMMVRKKSVKMVAKRRGVTSFFSGSVPRARMASICSVTIMEPSSLAIPEALRPETMRLVSTGPSSLIIERLTSSPVIAVAPNCAREEADCSASTPPVKNPVRITMGREPMPIESACVIRSAM